ncbi:MAG: cytochrome c oxidase subunit II [Leptolyngbya sp. LCM1.Bin17]|nr:MAG: cytochrome c oxidase subunit II [Leptolyngbya sp. LCM1.Bin17]
MKKSTEIVFYVVATALIIVLSFWLGHKAYDWMPVAATVEAQKVDDLFSFLVWLGSIIFLGITSVICFSLLTCRAERGDFTEGHSVRQNTKLEIIWTVIPMILVAVIVTRSVVIYDMLDVEGLDLLISEGKFTQLVKTALAQTSSTPGGHHHPGQPSPAAVTLAQAPGAPDSTINTIGVTARQFSWNFAYPDANITSTELHMPVNQPVRFSLTSEDVLHGFYVPEFRLKQEIIPQRTIDIVLTPIVEGNFTLHDSQLSGTYFALMDADVVVESEESYQQWLTQVASLPPTPAPNPAFDEYSHPQPSLLGHVDPAIAPKAPPIVNYHS